jgi:lipopolysaccharide export system permease protein
MENLIFRKLFRDINLFFFISIISIASVVWIIQAVNFLDLISEDGHGLKVYFLYTFFLLPKIISKILPFIYLISLIYILIRYEMNNELIVYWVNGISKLKFTNILIVISILYLFFQLVLTTLIVPYSLDKGRSYFRTSDIDLFSSIIKEKKFIDTVENLTIFAEEKNKNLLKNLLIKEKISNTESQIIVAKNGEFVNQNNQRIISLKDGKIINTNNDDQNIIDFSKFDLNLKKFSTNTITQPKTQEMSSIKIIRCIKKINEITIPDDDINFFVGCNYGIKDAMLEEFIKRFLAPLFILILGVLSSSIIISNKSERYYKTKNIFIFVFGVCFIFFSELFISFANSSIKETIVYFLITFITFFLLYIFQYLKLR